MQLRNLISKKFSLIILLTLLSMNLSLRFSEKNKAHITNEDKETSENKDKSSELLKSDNHSLKIKPFIHGVISSHRDILPEDAFKKINKESLKKKEKDDKQSKIPDSDKDFVSAIKSR